MASRGSKLSVLIVTREQAAFEATRRLLRDEQCELQEVKDANEALLTVLDNDIDVVILDTDASGGLDLDLATVIKRVRPKISLMALLDTDSMAAIGKVISCGIVYHAMKPVNDIEIVEVVKAIRNRMYQGQPQWADHNL